MHLARLTVSVAATLLGLTCCNAFYAGRLSVRSGASELMVSSGDKACQVRLHVCVVAWLPRLVCMMRVASVCVLVQRVALLLPKVVLCTYFCRIIYEYKECAVPVPNCTVKTGQTCVRMATAFACYIRRLDHTWINLITLNPEL